MSTRNFLESALTHLTAASIKPAKSSRRSTAASQNSARGTSGGYLPSNMAAVIPPIPTWSKWKDQAFLNRLVISSFNIFRVLKPLLILLTIVGLLRNKALA